MDSAATSGLSGRWPLVGRDELLAAAEAQLDQGRHVVLTGPAGSGKTRMAAVLLEAAAQRGVVVKRIVASPGAPIPLAPFATLIHGELGGDVVAAVLTALDATGRHGPGDPILVVDDAHALDPSSATVVHQLALAGTLRLVVTVRTAADVPEPIARLRREPSVSSITVPPLDDALIVAMVEQALDGPLDGRSQVLLTQAAGGNPMFARELIEGSLGAGILIRQAGLWLFTGDMTTTPALEELVLARLTPLPDAQRDALEMLAVGGALDHRLIAPSVGDEALERLERDGLIVAAVAQGPQLGPPRITVDVAHPLYREMVRARLGPIARMRICHQLAERTAAVGPSTPGEELVAVVWHVRGGVPIDATRLMRASDVAAGAGDPALAAELALAAHHVTPSAATALQAAWSLGQTRRPDEGIQLMTDTLERTVASHDRAALHLRISEDLWWTGDVAAGIQRLDMAEAEFAGLPVPDGPLPTARLFTAQRGVFAMLEGRLDDALAAATPLLDTDDLWARHIATIAVTHTLGYVDRSDEAIDIAGRTIAALEASPSAYVGDPKLHIVSQLVAMIHHGSLNDAVALCAMAYDVARTQPAVQVRAWAAMINGMATLAAGKLSPATRYFAEAERLWTEAGISGIARWCAAGLTIAQASLGATDEAIETHQRLSAYEPGGFTLFDPVVGLADAWVHTLQGNPAAAGEAIAVAAATSIATGNIQLWSHVVYEATRLDLLAALPALDSGPVATAPLSSARLALAAARLADDAAAIEAAAADFEALGALVAAAEATAFAAAGHRAAGRMRAATQCDGRVGALVAASGGASSPPLSTRSKSGPLSARESEIAGHAAAGLSNRQIADRLIVSERTVENHLYRIFIKLGVSSRDELAAALPR